MLHIGIVAGESSGDQLGGALIDALRRREPDLRITAMAGPKMRAAGCEVIAGVDELSVMGLVEVVRNYPRLRRLRERIYDYYATARPDVFVGIDVPDFVMNIEARLHRTGIKAVHYVAPQTWAWRQSRAAGLADNIDLLLTLFPFEAKFFEQHGVTTTFVGHPVADRIPLRRDAIGERGRLGLDTERRYVALMPGSRRQELNRHVDLFLATAQAVRRAEPDISFVANAVTAEAAQFVSARAAACGLSLTVKTGESHAVLRASDAALVASGTVTMEGLFAKTPLVVAYKLAPLSFSIMKRMVKVPFIAMPNLLEGDELVPEFLQGAAQPEPMAAALLAWLRDDAKVRRYEDRCTKHHQLLRRGAADVAAQRILSVARAEEGR